MLGSLHRMGAQIANTCFADDSKLSEGLQAEFDKFHNQIRLMLHYSKGGRRAKANDLVSGETDLKFGEQAVWIKYWGKVVAIEDYGMVRVCFDHFEYDDDEVRDWDKQAAKYLRKEIQIHAAEMEWDENHEEWSFSF